MQPPALFDLVPSDSPCLSGRRIVKSSRVARHQEAKLRPTLTSTIRIALCFQGKLPRLIQTHLAKPLGKKVANATFVPWASTEVGGVAKPLAHVRKDDG
jgi:hypothetical protein